MRARLTVTATLVLVLLAACSSAGIQAAERCKPSRPVPVVAFSISADEVMWRFFQEHPLT